MKTQRESRLINSTKNIFDFAQKSIFGKVDGHSVIIVNFCNNTDEFSSSFAKQVSKIYPQSEINYHLLGKNFLKQNPGYVQFIDVDREAEYNRRLIIANSICLNGTKHKLNPRPVNYAYLVKSMIEIKKFILNNFNSESKVQIYVPKIESRSNGIDKNILHILFEDIWNNITVVEFK